MSTEPLRPQDAEFVLANSISADIADATQELISGGQWMPDRTTPITAALLDYWFNPDQCDGRTLNFHPGQRDAILSVIYAHEVLGARSLPDLYDQAVGGAWARNPHIRPDLVDAPANRIPKYCVKMATGRCCKTRGLWRTCAHEGQAADSSAWMFHHFLRAVALSCIWSRGAVFVSGAVKFGSGVRSHGGNDVTCVGTG